MLDQQRRGSIRKRREQNRRDRELISDLVSMRKQLGIEQEDVAERMSVSQSTISRFESGATNPTQQTIRRYARIVGASIEYKIVWDAEVHQITEEKSAYQSIDRIQYGSSEFTLRYDDKAEA